MILFLLSFLGGALTIVSPCILPVLPFVFARADQPFVRSGLPLLLGMAVTFAGVATLAAVGGGWAVQANSYGRAGMAASWSARLHDAGEAGHLNAASGSGAGNRARTSSPS